MSHLPGSSDVLVEDVADDRLSREVWHFHVAWGLHGEGRSRGWRIVLRLAYYAREKRQSTRHKWQIAAWNQCYEAHRYSGHGHLTAEDVPLSKDIEKRALEAVLARGLAVIR